MTELPDGPNPWTTRSSRVATGVVAITDDGETAAQAAARELRYGRRHRR